MAARDPLDSPPFIDAKDTEAVMRYFLMHRERIEGDIIYQRENGNQVAIHYHLETGEVETKDVGSRTSVINVYSDLVDPVKKAIALYAKIQLMEWLYTLNDPNLNKQLSFLAWNQKFPAGVPAEKVEEIFALVKNERPGFRLFAHASNLTSTQMAVRNVLDTTRVNSVEIHALSDVKKAAEIIAPQVRPKAENN